MSPLQSIFVIVTITSNYYNCVEPLTQKCKCAVISNNTKKKIIMRKDQKIMCYCRESDEYYFGQRKLLIRMRRKTEEDFFISYLLLRLKLMALTWSFNSI